ncbi:MAG: hypothetical protein ACI8Q1_000253 [Parvicella sp.]|jgi:hypothetical protein
MKLFVKMYQSSTDTSYFLNDEPVKKDRKGNFTFFDGSNIPTIEGIKTHRNTRDTWGFPIKAEFPEMVNYAEGLHEFSEFIAHTLLETSQNAYIDGKKFTKFNLNKAIQINVTLDGVHYFDTKELLTHLNTFRMTYTKDKVKGSFTVEQLTKGLFHIFNTALRMNYVYKF